MPARWVTGQLETIGPILHTGAHDTDIMLWLTGARVVSAYAQTVNTLGLDYDDVAQPMYRFDSGATARDAFFRDYRVIFGSDLTATDSRALHEAELKTLRRGYARVIPLADILGGLDAA